MIKAGDIHIGGGRPCFVIAEVAQAHDGSLGMAHAYIDAVAKTGADAIKFQTHIADEESSSEEPWRVKFSYQDETRFDYWKRMEFTREQWQGLKEHADRSGLIFLSSPFSIAAVRLLDEIGVPAWKVASGEVNSFYLIDEMIKTGKPIILSSGMSYIEELDECAEYLNKAGAQWAILECTTAYPTQPEQIDLAQMAYYKERYGRPAGLSDHSGTIYPPLAAAALGADIIEVHVCFSRELFGPDVCASLTTGELKTMVEGVRYIDRIGKARREGKQTHTGASAGLARNGDKKARTDALAGLRKMFGKGIIARRDIKKGERFTTENIAFVKPNKGIGAGAYKRVLDSVAAADIAAKTFLTNDMIEGESGSNPQ